MQESLGSSISPLRTHPIKAWEAYLSDRVALSDEKNITFNVWVVREDSQCHRKDILLLELIELSGDNAQ